MLYFCPNSFSKPFRPCFYPAEESLRPVQALFTRFSTNRREQQTTGTGFEANTWGYNVKPKVSQTHCSYSSRTILNHYLSLSSQTNFFRGPITLFPGFSSSSSSEPFLSPSSDCCLHDTQTQSVIYKYIIHSYIHNPTAWMNFTGVTLTIITMFLWVSECPVKKDHLAVKK